MTSDPFPSSSRRATGTAPALAAACALIVAGCGGSSTTTNPPESQSSESIARTSAVDLAAVADRLDEVEAAIEDWSAAVTLAEARAGAEAAHNLVGGTATLGAGDRDGDGTINGDVDRGLLPAARRAGA